MTTDVALLSKINTLPPDLKVEVLKYVDFLLYTQQEANETLAIKAKETPKAGFGRMQFIMAEDFDAPLDDFKEYME